MPKSSSNYFLQPDVILERLIKLAEKYGKALGLIDLIRMTVNSRAYDDSRKIEEIRKLLARYLPEVY